MINWLTIPVIISIFQFLLLIINGVESEGQGSDFAVSVQSLYRLVIEETDFVTFLEDIYLPNYGGLDNEFEQSIHNYLDNYRKDLMETLERWKAEPLVDLMDVVTHPFMIYQILCRNVYDYHRIYSILKDQQFDSLPEFGESQPTEQDIFDFGFLIVLMQHAYDLDINHFGYGNFGSQVTGLSLNSMEAIELAQFAASLQLYSRTVQWLSFAADQTDGSDDYILEELRKAIEIHDQAWIENNQNLTTFSTKIGSLENFRNYPTEFTTFPYQSGEIEQNRDTYITHNFMKVCRGENLQTEHEKKLLKCWYDSRFSVISPFKMELMSSSPHDLLKIHEFIGENEAEELMDFGLERLQKVHFHDSLRQGAVSVASVDRFQDSPENLEKVEKKIEMITGYQPHVDDSMEIFAHAPGGHYAPIIDPSLATFMIYLNDVEIGGTAFPLLGFNIKPERRSAIFFYSQLTNLETDYQMIHGGCNVVFGQQWVFTKLMGKRET